MVEKALWNECLGAGVKDDLVRNPQRQGIRQQKAHGRSPGQGACSGARLCPVLSFSSAVEAGLAEATHQDAGSPLPAQPDPHRSCGHLCPAWAPGPPAGPSPGHHPLPGSHPGPGSVPRPSGGGAPRHGTHPLCPLLALLGGPGPPSQRSLSPPAPPRNASVPTSHGGGVPGQPRKNWAGWKDRCPSLHLTGESAITPWPQGHAHPQSPSLPVLGSLHFQPH